MNENKTPDFTFSENVELIFDTIQESESRDFNLMLFISPLLVLILGIGLMENRYSDTKIFWNNYRAFFKENERVLSMNLQKNSAIIGTEINDKEYFNLSKTFLNSVQIGDTLSKMGQTNYVYIIKNKRESRNKIQFATVPEKVTKKNSTLNLD